MKAPLVTGEPHEPLTQPGCTPLPGPAHRPGAQRVQCRRGRAQARIATGQWTRARSRRPARHLAAHAGARPRPLRREALRHPRHGAPVRTAAQLRGGAGRREAPRGPQPGQPRQPRSHAHAAAGPARGGQDALRPPLGRPAGHRHEPGAHEQHDRGLAALGLVIAVERRQTGQGVRGAGGRPVRQPRDRGGRNRQGQCRRAVRPARRPVQPAGTRHRPALHRRVRRGAHRRQPGDLGDHRQRRTRHSRAHPEPHERVRDLAAHAGGRPQDRRPPLPRHPGRTRLGSAL